MSSPASHHRHHHSRPAKVHSPSTSSGVDKRRKLMNHPTIYGGGGNHFPPPNGAAYPHHQGYYISEGGGIPDEGSGAGGPPPLPLPPSHGYGYAPPIHQHPGSAAAAGHHHPPPAHDPYYINRTGSAAGGGIVPPPGEGYYLGPPPPPPHGAPPPSIHQPRGYNNNNNTPLRLSPHQYNNGGDNEGDYENSSASKSPPKVLLHPIPGTSPGATNNGDDNNGSETTPTSVMANDDTLDTRSPEGSRNLNPLEERVEGITDSHSDEQRQHQQQQAITRSSSGAPITSSTPGKGGGQAPNVVHNSTVTPSSMVRMPPYHHGMHPPPLPPPGMVPYHGPPSHQGMHHQHPHNRHHLHPYMPPTIVPQSSHHHHVGAFPSHTHQPHSHPAAHHPGVPQFLPQFHMSPQHHRNALPRGSGDSNMTQQPPGQMSPEGRGSDSMMMSMPPPHLPAMLGGPLPPSSSSTTTRVVNSNGETIWTCEYCDLKFNTWEDCAAHEEADCPAAASHHHNRHHHHQPRPHLQGYGPPPLGQYPMHAMHNGMMHPSGHDNVLSGNQHIQPYSDVGRNAHNRSLKGRKMALSAFPNNGHLFVDHNAEYAVNTDRVTYLFSTSSDVDSLSDRQCYVRTHFVEIFVATAADVGARHSRGAQMLNLGQIGLRCAYCVKLRQRDRAERAICYPSSISRIYQTVADMQRFHFESCVAIPPKVLHAYRSLKTTRPRGVGSPQSYWDQSARNIGLVDSKFGIQVADGDVKFEMQRKSVVTGMLAIMDEPNDASRDALIMRDMLARQEDGSEEEGKQYEVSSFQPHQDPQAMQVHETTIQAAVVSSPGSDTGSKAEDEDGNFGVAPSTPKTAKDVEAEEDANILLMLKKTPESPPRVDSLEGSNSIGSVEYATLGRDDGTNPTDAVNDDGFVAV